MSGGPFDLSVFATPHLRIVSVEVASSTAQFAGGFSPEQIRTLGHAMLGAADVAEGNLDTPDAIAFLATGNVSGDGGDVS